MLLLVLLNDLDGVSLPLRFGSTHDASRQAFFSVLWPLHHDPRKRQLGKAFILRLASALS